MKNSGSVRLCERGLTHGTSGNVLGGESLRVAETLAVEAWACCPPIQPALKKVSEYPVLARFPNQLARTRSALSAGRYGAPGQFFDPVTPIRFDGRGRRRWRIQDIYPSI
jgi:hypothetical protein